MTQAQKGICAEPNLHALFLIFNVIDDDDQAMRSKLAHILELFTHFDEEHYEAMVSGILAVGSHYWHELYPGLIPLELAPFPDMHCEDRNAPVSPGDLFIQIRADRLDICHAIGIEICQILQPNVDLLEEVRGFRYLDGRDLTGFIGSTHNPKGMQKFDVAVVGDNDSDFAGGSYIHVQKYRFNMQKWQTLLESDQEEIMGCAKSSNQPFEPTEIADYSHAKRSNFSADDQEKITLLRQSMPFGDMSVQGTMFVSCASSPQPFKKMLRSMIFGTEQGMYDRLLDYMSAESGGAFFAPSVSFIKQQAKS
jgi:putative iron-dependent peroxidase